MKDYNFKIREFILPHIKDIKNIKILEFGVKEGRSTKMFLDICKKNNGKLISVDVNDYENLFDDKNWTFLQTRDDNFEKISKLINQDLDIIYLDSLHEAKHVEKILYYYFDHLKIGGNFFIDDVSWLPYLKNKQRSNFYCEINNKETFEKLIEIYNNNTDKFDIYFSFVSSGICRILKNNEKLNNSSELVSREFSFRNLIRKIV